MIPLNGLYRHLEEMLDNKWGYIYGTAGELWTEQKQSAYRDKWEDDPTRGTSSKYGGKWVCHIVTDCSGVMVYIWAAYGLTIPHGSSTMIRQGYIVDLGSDPRPGWAALTKNNHIGIVGPDGVTVYEARGTIAGFTTSKVTDPKWEKFGRFVDVDYTRGGDVPVGESYRATVNIESGHLNIRSGPGKEYPIIGQLDKGEEVVVQYSKDGWAYITWPKSGYVSADYLLPVDPPEPVDPDGDEWMEDQILESENGATIHLVGRWRRVG